MSKGRVIGSAEFAKAKLQEYRELVGQGRRMAAALKATREALWREELERLLRKLRRTPADLTQGRKTAGWKAAIAAAPKSRTNATNRWLGENLHLGGLHEVSRQVGAWRRQPDPAPGRKPGLNPNS